MSERNFDFALTATIGDQMIKELVIAEVENRTGRKVKSLKFTTRQVTDYMDRFSTTEFSGATIVFESPKDLRQ